MLIVCPSCDSKVLVPDGLAGRKGQCSKCGAVFPIPTAPAGAPLAADEAITTAPPRQEAEPTPARDPGRYDDQDEASWDEPRSLRRSDGPSVALSQAAMIVGIVAMVSGTIGPCCCGVLSTPVTGLAGVAAIVLGVIGRSRGGQGLAVAGMGLGFVAILLALGWIGLFFAVGGADLVGNMFRGRF